MSYIINDFVKVSLKRLAMNFYYNNYYGNFSWLGDEYLWTNDEKIIFNQELESLKQNDFIKSALDDNDEYNRLLRERGIAPLRRSYNTLSEEIYRCRFHDRNGNFTICEDLIESDKKIADEISNKIKLMNHKESAGLKIVSFIKRRVLNRN